MRLLYSGALGRFDTQFGHGIPAVGRNANAVPQRNDCGEPSYGLTKSRNAQHQATELAEIGSGWLVDGDMVWRTETSKRL